MRFLYDSLVSVLKSMDAYNRRNKFYFSLVSSLLRPSSCQKILDVGAGTGAISNLIGKNGFVVGVDINKNAFKADKPRFFHRVIGDAHHMPFRDGIFDATLFISCVEHLGDPFACMKEICRISSRGSLCIAQLPNLQWFLEPHTKFPLLFLLPKFLSARVKKSCGYDSLNLDVTLKKFLSWFSLVGFTNTYRLKIFHGFQLLKFVPWPPGWFLAFQKQTPCYNPSDHL